MSDEEALKLVGIVESDTQTFDGEIIVPEGIRIPCKNITVNFDSSPMEKDIGVATIIDAKGKVLVHIELNERGKKVVEELLNHKPSFSIEGVESKEVILEGVECNRDFDDHDEN